MTLWCPIIDIDASAHRSNSHIWPRPWLLNLQNLNLSSSSNCGIEYCITFDQNPSPHSRVSMMLTRCMPRLTDTCTDVRNHGKHNASPHLSVVEIQNDFLWEFCSNYVSLFCTVSILAHLWPIFTEMSICDTCCILSTGIFTEMTFKAELRWLSKVTVNDSMSMTQFSKL